MGSKSPFENGHHQHQAPPANPLVSNHDGGKSAGSHKSQDGDGCLGDGSGDNDDSDGDGDAGQVVYPEQSVTNSTTAAATQQKRKKPKKKKTKKKKSASQQSSPPRVPLTDLFPTGIYPEGEVQQYSAARTSSAELRYNDRLLHWQDETWLSNYRKAAEVHRQTRLWLQETVKPGQTLHVLADGIEDSARALLGNSGLETGAGLQSGMGFPTGLCLNHQVAHYTPNPGQKEVILQPSDLLTVDFGIHINGWIVDSAFTMAFDPMYDGLLEAVKDATNTGVRTAGIDVRISDVSAAIQEAMESHEVEINGKIYPVKPVRNLSAHNIAHYRIHGGKSIPFVNNNDQTKMEEGEVFAIETFGSTGRGSIVDDVGVYGYGINENAPLRAPVTLTSARKLHKTIRENFSTLVFNRRYLERLGVERYLAGMNSLVRAGVVEEYVPLCDIKGSYSAQFEHTILLHPTHKEVLSRGPDY